MSRENSKPKMLWEVGDVRLFLMPLPESVALVRHRSGRLDTVEEFETEHQARQRANQLKREIEGKS